MRPRILLYALLASAALSVAAIATASRVTPPVRIIWFLCGIFELPVGSAIAFNFHGIGDQLREQKLTWWMIPTFVSPKWAEQPRIFSYFRATFGGVFAFYGLGLVAGAVHGPGLVAGAALLR